MIIGSGITSTSVTRELSKYKLETILVEKEGHIASGQTKASSGTIYGGGLNLEEIDEITKVVQLLVV